MNDSPTAYKMSDAYPTYSYIQRVQGELQTTRAPGPQTGVNFFPIAEGINRPASTITFNAPQVAQNLFLCADAYIKVKLRVRRYKIDNVTDIASVSDGNWWLDRAPMKPGMVIANSLTRADVRLNQHTISYKDLRYVQKNINVQSFGKEFIETRLSTSGAKYWDNVGQLSFTGECSNNVSDFLSPVIGVLDYSTNLGVDNGYNSSCDKWNSFPGDTTADPLTVGTRVIEIVEPLGIGPFKPRNQEGFGNSVYHGLSDLIPYVNQVGVKLVLENYTANMVEPYFMNIAENDPAAPPYRGIYLDDGIESAELVLKWVRPREELILQIPKQLYIPSWQVDHREFQLNVFPESIGGYSPLINNAEAPGLDFPGFPNTGTKFTFENIHTHQIPSQIMMWATVDKDDPESYMASPINVWNSPITTIFLSTEQNNQTAFESNCALREINVRTNALGGTDIWNQSFNEDEQYKYTTEACHPDFPWSNNKWNGYVLNLHNPGGGIPTLQNYYATKGYNFMVLDTDDLKQYNITNQKTGKLVRDQVWNFSGRFSPKDGFMDNTGYTVLSYDGLGPVPETRNSRRRYKFHVAFLYNNYRINLGSDGVVSSDFVSKFY